MMSSGASRRGATTVVASLLTLIALCAAPSQGAVRESAHAARRLQGSDTAHLRFLRLTHNGEWLFEEGEARGALQGTMRAELDVELPVFQGTFTIIKRNGRINGRGKANAHGSGRYQSFAGFLTITGGSGEFAHVHGRASLYGTLDRRTYAAVVQTTGSLTY